MFTAPLSAITAAVVGVVLNLAMFFAYHVFWPREFEGEFQGFAVLISIAAFIALFRFRAGIITVVLTCGIIGILFNQW